MSLISKRSDIETLPLQTLLRPVSDATAALARLDERLAGSTVREGWIERTHYLDACASLWVDGELVHIEDLVLHDAGADIRTPTHELTIARDVLRTRRRIAAQPTGWALGAEGLRSLRGEGRAEESAPAADERLSLPSRPLPAGGQVEESEDEVPDPLAAELAAIDAVLARSEAALADVKRPARGAVRAKNTLVYDADWDEDERLDAWRAVLTETAELPPVLRAVLLLDAWDRRPVLQHAAWLGRLLAASCLRDAGLTTASHLATVNLGLKAVRIERRTHRDREARLLARLEGIVLATEAGFKEHDRLLLARQMMERRLAGRRQTSKLPELVEFVLSRPLVSAGMVAKALEITPRAALALVQELNLRELTGRGRFRAWGIV
ncbi:MAG: hypothetical protein DI589_15955 [Shinella sp.]|nr:MAG: hypothetical protein DI589_15955 [Shinella sp.]